MTVERMFDASYQISDIVLNGLFTRRYFGYTKVEAVMMFKREVKKMLERGF